MGDDLGYYPQGYTSAYSSGRFGSYHYGPSWHTKLSDWAHAKLHSFRNSRKFQDRPTNFTKSFRFGNAVKHFQFGRKNYIKNYQFPRKMSQFVFRQPSLVGVTKRQYNKTQYKKRSYTRAPTKQFYRKPQFSTYTPRRSYTPRTWYKPRKYYIPRKTFFKKKSYSRRWY